MLIHADALDFLRETASGSVALAMSSPPYNIGKEYDEARTIDEYAEWQGEVIAEVARTLRPGGSICWQVGNHVRNGAVTPIDALLWPYLSAAGLTLRNRIVWVFGHGLHCSRRFSGRHETILWATKGDDYTFNLDSVRVPSKYPGKRHYKGPKKGELSGNPLGKNPGDWWEITNVKHNHPEKTGHPCQYPEALVSRLVLALTDEGDIVIDPFVGSGTTVAVANQLGRVGIGADNCAGYLEMAQERLLPASAGTQS